MAEMRSDKLKDENGVLRERCTELTTHVEFWIADGHLQTFPDRERFRKLSREMLARHRKAAP